MPAPMTPVRRNSLPNIGSPGGLSNPGAPADSTPTARPTLSGAHGLQPKTQPKIPPQPNRLRAALPGIASALPGIAMSALSTPDSKIGVAAGIAAQAVPSLITAFQQKSDVSRSETATAANSLRQAQGHPPGDLARSGMQALMNGAVVNNDVTAKLTAKMKADFAQTKLQSDLADAESTRISKAGNDLTDMV